MYGQPPDQTISKQVSGTVVLISGDFSLLNPGGTPVGAAAAVPGGETQPTTCGPYVADATQFPDNNYPTRAPVKGEEVGWIDNNSNISPADAPAGPGVWRRTATIDSEEGETDDNGAGEGCFRDVCCT